MTVEIERKFVVEDVPDDIELGPGIELRQGYLADADGVAVRVRISDREAWLTVKAGRGLARTEVEVPLTHEQAEALWPHTGAGRLSKRRHRVRLDDGHVAEVDVYAGALEGLRTAEVEFATEADARRFRPPPWFGRDVTDDARWSNLALARDGRPDRR